MQRRIPMRSNPYGAEQAGPRTIRYYEEQPAEKLARGEGEARY